MTRTQIKPLLLISITPASRPVEGAEVHADTRDANGGEAGGHQVEERVQPHKHRLRVELSFAENASLQCNQIWNVDEARQSRIDVKLARDECARLDGAGLVEEPKRLDLQDEWHRNFEDRAQVQERQQAPAARQNIYQSSSVRKHPVNSQQVLQTD